MKRLLSIVMMFGLLCHGQMVKNSSFEQGGKDAADGWKLSGQPGGVSEDGARMWSAAERIRTTGCPTRFLSK